MAQMKSDLFLSLQFCGLPGEAQLCSRAVVHQHSYEASPVLQLLFEGCLLSVDLKEMSPHTGFNCGILRCTAQRQGQQESGDLVLQQSICQIPPITVL